MRRGTVEEIVYEVKKDEGPSESIYTSRDNRVLGQPVSSRVVEFRRSSSPKINFNISSRPQPATTTF